MSPMSRTLSDKPLAAMPLCGSLPLMKFRQASARRESEGTLSGPEPHQEISSQMRDEMAANVMELSNCLLQERSARRNLYRLRSHKFASAPARARHVVSRVDMSAEASESESVEEPNLQSPVKGRLAADEAPWLLPASVPIQRRGTVLFDWDDTLFPTWHICEVVLRCMPGASAIGEGEPLPLDSPFAPALARHAEIVEKVLRTASAHAQVGIVTLGRKPWVRQSAARFLPGLDLEQLLQELDIPVVYARDCMQTRQIAEAGEGVNLFAVAKTRAMRKVFKKHTRSQSFSGNVVSIGDSDIERVAVKDLLWGYSQEMPGKELLCKTVKLIEEPTLDHLGTELRLMTQWLEVMIAHPEDVDISLGDDTECTLQKLQRFVH